MDADLIAISLTLFCVFDATRFWTNKQFREEPYDFLFQVSSRPPPYGAPGRHVVTGLFRRPLKRGFQIWGDLLIFPFWFLKCPGFLWGLLLRSESPTGTAINPETAKTHPKTVSGPDLSTPGESEGDAMRIRKLRSSSTTSEQQLSTSHSHPPSILHFCAPRGRHRPVTPGHQNKNHTP